MQPVQDYLCVDLETTGLNPKQDKIIEIGAIRVRNGQVEDSFHTMVHPGRMLSPRAEELTKLTEEDLRDAPLIGEVIPGFLEFAGELPLLGHFVLFDYSFLKRAAVNARCSFEREGIDTLKIARKYLSGLPGRQLSALCAHYGIEIQAHRALGDAGATHLLYQRLCRDFFDPEDCAEFMPQPLIYKAKREGPATRAQKERLQTLFVRYSIVPDCEIELLTKNEASRLIDRILAAYGSLQK